MYSLNLLFLAIMIDPIVMIPTKNPNCAPEIFNVFPTS